MLKKILVKPEPMVPVNFLSLHTVKLTFKIFPPIFYHLTMVFLTTQGLITIKFTLSRWVVDVHQISCYFIHEKLELVGSVSCE